MAMMDRGQTAAEDSRTKDNDSKDSLSVGVRAVVKDDESRNSPSGAPGKDPGTAAGGINPQILRRPTRKLVDSNEDQTAASLPVPAKVQLDVGFERGVPIPDLPHPLLDASSKSEAFDDIRQWLLGGADTPRQEVRVEEDDLDLVESDGDLRGLFAVDSLKYFIGNIRFDDATTTSQQHVLS